MRDSGVKCLNKKNFILCDFKICNGFFVLPFNEKWKLLHSENSHVLHFSLKGCSVICAIDTRLLDTHLLDKFVC